MGPELGLDEVAKRKVCAPTENRTLYLASHFTKSLTSWLSTRKVPGSKCHL